MADAPTPTTIWMIFKPDLQTDLSLNLGGGRKAAVCFSSESNARHFQKSAFSGAQCKFVEMPGDVFVEWLRTKIKSGSQFIYKDPKDLDNLGKATPILDLLILVE
jgi:hypothetical protein